MSPASRPHPLLQFSAGGLVVDERGSVLLIRARDLRNQPVWTLPKGALNPGESAADAALREVREETGWECEVVRELESVRSEEHTSELQSRSDLVCRLLLEKKKKNKRQDVLMCEQIAHRDDE